MIGLLTSDEIGTTNNNSTTNKDVAVPTIVAQNEHCRVNLIYNYHKNNYFAGELKRVVPRLLKNQSKLEQELTAYKKWERFNRDVDKDDGLKKRDRILLSIGTLKDAWELVCLESDPEPIHKLNYRMYKQFVHSVFSMKFPDIRIQKAQRIFMRLRNTSPEIICGWDYKKAHIANNQTAYIWLAANFVLGSNWTWAAFNKIGPSLLPDSPLSPSSSKDSTMNQQMNLTRVPRKKEELASHIKTPTHLLSTRSRIPNFVTANDVELIAKRSFDQSRHFRKSLQQSMIQCMKTRLKNRIRHRTSKLYIKSPLPTISKPSLSQVEDDVPSGNITICDSTTTIYDNINLNNVTDENAITSTSKTLPTKGTSSRIAKLDATERPASLSSTSILLSTYTCRRNTAPTTLPTTTKSGSTVQTAKPISNKEMNFFCHPSGIVIDQKKTLAFKSTITTLELCVNLMLHSRENITNILTFIL